MWGEAAMRRAVTYLDFRNKVWHSDHMDTFARNVINQARDLLDSKFRLSAIIEAPSVEQRIAVATVVGHGIDSDELQSLSAIFRELTSLLDGDTTLGRCLHCGSFTIQVGSGRQRVYCSDACRQADYRKRRSWAVDVFEVDAEGSWRDGDLYFFATNDQAERFARSLPLTDQIGPVIYPNRAGWGKPQPVAGHITRWVPQ